MSMTDPVADFLTRIRNGLHADRDDVETIVVPMPPWTLGTSPAATYVRRPGLETRWMPWMTGLRSSVYLRRTRSVRPTRAGSSEKSSM